MDIATLLTQYQAAERADVIPRTIRNWVKTGRLEVAWQAPGPKGLKLFRPEDVDRAATGETAVAS